MQFKRRDGIRRQASINFAGRQSEYSFSIKNHRHWVEAKNVLEVDILQFLVLSPFSGTTVYKRC